MFAGYDFEVIQRSPRGVEPHHGAKFALTARNAFADRP